MIVNLYDSAAAGELVAALSTDSTAPPSPNFAERTVIATGGLWQPRGWDVDLHQSATPLTVLGLRTPADEPAPSSRAWARIARTLARGNGWHHNNWVALRTSAQSMVLLAAPYQRLDPARLDRTVRVVRRWQTFTGRTPPWTVPADAAVPPVGEPLRILDARFDRWQRLTVLVPHIPTLDELRFTAHPLPPGPHPQRVGHTGSDTLYVANHLGGYVHFLLDTGDGQGSNSEAFDLHLVDGTTQVVVGPWSSSADVVSRHAPAANIHTDDVVLHDTAEDFHAGRSGSRGSLTRTAAQHALRIAAEQHQSAPSGRAFNPPAHAQTGVIPHVAAHPIDPSQGHGPPRRSR